MRFNLLATRSLMIGAALLPTTSIRPMGIARSDDVEKQQAAITLDDHAKPVPNCAAILQQAAATIDGAPGKDSLLRAIVGTLARAGLTEEALRLANAERRDGLKHSLFRDIAISQALSHQFDQALKTARQIRSPERKEAIAIIAANQAWAGNGPSARRLIEEEFKNEPDRSVALRGVATALEETGDFTGAAQAFEAIPSLREKVMGCRARVRACLKAGDIPGALRAAEESSEFARQYLAQELRRKGSSPPIIERDSVKNVILGEITLEQARMGDGVGARGAAESISDRRSRTVTMAKAAAILARAGDREEAMTLIQQAFNLLEEVGASGVELTEIAKAQFQVGETEAARKTFLQALETVGPAVMNQSMIPGEQARVGDLEGAMQSLKAIKNVATKQGALRYLSRTLAKQQHIATAIELADRISYADDRALALREVSEAQSEAGDQAGALTTIGRVMAIDAHFEDETLQTVGCTMSRLGDVRGALDWVDRRSTPATKARGLLGVAQGMLPPVSGPNIQGLSSAFSN